MATFADFHDRLMPELPGISVAMVNIHLLDTARDYCEATKVWRANLTAVNSVANQAAYSIALSDSEVVRVLKLTVAGVVLFDNDWTDDSQTDRPRYPSHSPPFTMSTDGQTLTFDTDEIPVTTATGSIEINAALRPKLGATTLPDFLKTEHMEAMRVGTLSRLMLMGKKPWTDRDMGMSYLREFISLKSLAAYNAQAGNTKQRLKVRKWG